MRQRSTEVETTADRPAPGLVVHQPKRGFRYGAEAFWLVGYALSLGPPPASAVDLGTGSGVMALLLGRLGVPAHGVDVRAEWRPLWRDTLAESSVSASVRLTLRDVSEGPLGPVDLVVSNPPFFTSASGPRAADPWRAAARTESTATLHDFVAVAVGSLGPSGRACFVVPRERAHELEAHPSCRQVVHVGRRRTLLAFGAVAAAAAREVADRGPEVRTWYALAGAGSGV